MKIKNYFLFINESIETETDHILNYLKDNKINNWQDFIKMSKFKKDVIKKLIPNEFYSDVIFNLRLKLSDKAQLSEFLKQLENNEEYEKCKIIQDFISHMQ